MKNNEILGYSRFTSKKGVDTLICHIATEPSEQDKQFGWVGFKTEQVFVPANDYNKFSPAVIGKQLKRGYQINGFRATVVSVEIV